MQYASYSPIFRVLHCVINAQQHERHLYHQFSHYKIYGMIGHQCAYLNYGLEKVGTQTVYHYALFPATSNIRVTLLRVKNSIRSAPASIALTQVSHWSHDAHTANYYLSGSELSGERVGAQRRTKISFGRTRIGGAAVGEKARLGMKQHWAVKKSSL